MKILQNIKLRNFAALAVALLCFQTISAQKRPVWTYNKPDAPNATFTYRVEWGAGENIIVAYNQALSKIINSTANAIGMKTSTGAIKEALESGESFDVVSETLKVPFNKVCEFEENLGGGLYRVFVLCQAAKNANVKPLFVEFTNCYDKDEMTGTNLESEEQKAERQRQALLKQQEETRKAEEKKKEEATKKAYPKAFKNEQCLFNITQCTRMGNVLEIHGLVQNQGSQPVLLTMASSNNGHYSNSGNYIEAYTNTGRSYKVTRVYLGDKRASGNYLRSGASKNLPPGVTLRFKYEFDGVSSGFDSLSGITIGTCVDAGRRSRRSHSFKNLPVTD